MMKNVSGVFKKGAKAEMEAGFPGGMTEKRITTLVSTYGVNFALTATARKHLTDDGADDNLLAAISASHR
jgi:hypothetical protein